MKCCCFNFSLVRELQVKRNLFQ